MSHAPSRAAVTAVSSAPYPVITITGHESRNRRNISIPDISASRLMSLNSRSNLSCDAISSARSGVCAVSACQPCDLNSSRRRLSDARSSSTTKMRFILFGEDTSPIAFMLGRSILGAPFVSISVFKRMKIVSHRGHREHREMIMSSVPSVFSVAIHPYEKSHGIVDLFSLMTNAVSQRLAQRPQQARRRVRLRQKFLRAQTTRLFFLASFRQAAAGDDRQ